MATVTRKLAFYDLRDYWLADERIAELLNYTHDESDPHNNPFFPVSQQPEGGFPYVRYTVGWVPQFPQWWVETENVGVEIFTFDIEDSTELLRRMKDLAQEGATSARDLSIWLDEQGREQDFEYHSIEFVGGGDIGAPSEEGATHSRIAHFAIQYSPRHGRNIA